ncbi:MAG: hypothetical protein ACYS8W_01055 [Planctomycetota bacterium]|jgi:hypothetical protein
MEFPETSREKKSRRRILFFKIAIYVSWGMMALGFGVIIYKVING